VTGFWPCVVFLFLYVAAASAFFGATFATIFDTAPPRMRGAITAYVMLLINLGGYGVGPQLTGLFSDLFRGAGAAEPLRWALMAVTPVLLLSSLFYLLVGRRLNAQQARSL
jgi:MFS family permease